MNYHADYITKNFLLVLQRSQVGLVEHPLSVRLYTNK